MEDFENQLKVAYFAGIIDGEGYVGLVPNNKSKTPGRFFPVITVGMTCPETVYALQSFFKCGSIHIRPEQLNRKIQYYWKISNRAAKLIAEQIIQYSITKRENLQRILDYNPEKVILLRDSQGRFTGV